VDDRLKRRLIGAAVLASLAVIFVPMLVEEEREPGIGMPGGTTPPREHLTFKSQVLKEEITVPTDAPPPAAGEESAAGPADATTSVPPVEPVADEPPPPPPPPRAPAPKVAESAQPAAPEKPKAPPPAQVAKATPPAPKPPATPAPRITTWIVQVGNYSSREKADSVARQLRGKGLEVFIEPIGTPPVFRVAVGPEAERKRAEALISRITAAVPGASKPFIRSYP
jgi:DedD protein